MTLMGRRPWWTVFSVSFALSAWSSSRLKAAEGPTIHAEMARGPIQIDGVLDDPAWAGAAIIQDLTQQEPQPGQPTPFRTEVRILIDADHVYLGFTCLDPDPEKIAVHTLQRDGSLDADDHVAVAFDTFLDARTGYFFRINAAGSREDGLISGPESASSDWDGIWEGRTRRTAGGWTAELAIPAKTLHFTSGGSEWGFNVERVVPRTRLHLRWTGTSLDAAWTDMRRTGRLSGVESLRQGLGLSIVPYGLARYESRRLMGSTTEGDVGGDVTYNPTPSLSGVLTVNTDFAETEVDLQQINLTRFPLFFPEKRAFFLEGSTQFDFGLGLGSDFIPFFSRRIGLFEGRRVPIVAGIKLLGRAGPWGIGLVDAYTRDLGQLGDSPGAEGSNLGSARVTFDASSHLRLGGIYTDGDPAGTTTNRLTGLDSVWQTSTLFGGKNLAFAGWAARSSGDLKSGDPNGYGFSIEYPNDLWYWSFDARHLGDALEPKLGFLPRPGTRQYNGYLAYQPRPEGGAFGWARQFFFELEPRWIENVDGVTESWRVFTAPFNVVTQHGDHFEANWVPQFEHLVEPFDITDDVSIPSGSYHFSRYRIQAESSEHRPWVGAATVYLGGFFSGRLTQTEASVSYATPSGRQRIELDSENDYGHLPEGDFIERLQRLRWTCSFSPDLTLAALAQYEEESRILGWNLRLRWTVKPGDDIFFVWNRDWLRTDPESGLRFSRESDQVVVKTRWTFRR